MALQQEYASLANLERELDSIRWKSQPLLEQRSVWINRLSDSVTRDRLSQRIIELRTKRERLVSQVADERLYQEVTGSAEGPATLEYNRLIIEEEEIRDTLRLYSESLCKYYIKQIDAKLDPLLGQEREILNEMSRISERIDRIKRIMRNRA